MNNQTNQCQKCSEAKLGQECSKCFLDENKEVRCQECANKDTVFLDEVDGKCKFQCLPGMVNGNQETFSDCKCEDGYMTSEGCKTCSDGIPGCQNCKEDNQFTQIPLLSNLLTPNDKYLQCNTCEGQGDQTGGLSFSKNFT